MTTPRTKSASPTQLTLQHCARLGWTADKAEYWLPSRADKLVADAARALINNTNGLGSGAHMSRLLAAVNQSDSMGRPGVRKDLFEFIDVVALVPRDDTPADEEWLQSIGFHWEELSPRQLVLRGTELDLTYFNGSWFVDDSSDRLMLTNRLPGKTRAEVLQLCDALLGLNVEAPRPGILAIQCTTVSNQAARLAKLKSLPAAKAWLESGGAIEVWGWKKYAKPVDRRKWRETRTAVTLADFEAKEAPF